MGQVHTYTEGSYVNLHKTDVVNRDVLDLFWCGFIYNVRFSICYVTYTAMILVYNDLELLQIVGIKST